MFIERLTLKNFKSFGGTHELPFAPGFTAIVGPNGSGKSNILDGLRWVLGESGAARLRITRQSDLIFQGSAGLSEATETDVSLELSDDGGRATLRRHLDASGGTLYVNGARTRVQDLAQFKQQWHLEGDKSAFIGQGEVGAAVLQKPFQRRLQLEELFAGPEPMEIWYRSHKLSERDMAMVHRLIEAALADWEGDSKRAKKGAKR